MEPALHNYQIINFMIACIPESTRFKSFNFPSDSTMYLIAGFVIQHKWKKQYESSSRYCT